ncbi:Quinidine resistance protein 1 [Sphaceloma murrayae]|uniref:Quinidine resistance protein 1 n=1 Tax=Sphaceloma murrayae TaxID=2082308 RepID=A0A2K1QHT5_9PEZI|nr:Quinidine resistance protein 1 [Sphaceloma murrayae]
MAQNNTPQSVSATSQPPFHPTEDVEAHPAHTDKPNPLTKQSSHPADLVPISSHVSGHDIHLTHYETGDEIYSKFPHHRKLVIVTVLSFCSFLAPVSSTTVLAAVPEVAATYSTTGTVINLSNALYQLFMGLSPIFWGPMGQAYGRRWTQLLSAVLFTAFSIGTALAPNLASFFVFRILTAFQGTSFLIIGSACIGDIYRPTERATALSWFLSGTLIGPAFGPFLGGVIVTYKPWQDIFWMQTGIAAGATVLVFFFLPETIHYKKSVELEGLTTREKVAKFWEWMNPLRVIKLWKFPNLALVGFATGALVWNMYSLLTPIRYVLNPRFNLSTPMQSGLFYIAPGCGYLLGTFFGGKWADRVVKKWIGKRDGLRVPEDRLKSCLIALGVVMPGCMLIYGWTVEKKVGGIPVPVIAMFVQGIAQLFCFPSLNTYCLDVMQKRSAEVVSGNYVSRYLFGAIGSAVVLPFVEQAGVGWFSTLSAGLLASSAVGVWATTIWGRKWREAVIEKEERKAIGKQAGTAEHDAREEK